MDNKQLGLYLEIGGIVVGVVAALVLVTQHPIHIVVLGLGAAIYFVGQFIKG
jgi:hypothetical protein